LFGEDFLSDKMDAKLNVLSLGMKNGVVREGYSTKVVTQKSRSVKWYLKLTEKGLNPKEICCGIGHASVFSLSAGPSNKRLLLRTP
jgi:hypothetical protein